ncbi:MAG TPA: dTDP-glucose 4,6-dehydratase [Trebonia sp.]
MSVYLVAGGAGFIGTNFVSYLRTRNPGDQVVVVDYLGFASNEDNLTQFGDAVEFRAADISDPAAMTAVYREFSPDFVVNFAAESHNDRAILDPSLFMRSNAMGAQVLLECSRQHPVLAHLHVSTIEVYGELAADKQYFTEGSPLNAKTPYSAAKAAGDQIVRAYMQTYRDMNIRMTHCANNYGPFQLPEKLIPLMITNVLRGRKVPVYGDGLQMRDWLHVDDHCAAIYQVLHADLGPIPEGAATDPGKLPVFDISARQELTNLDIVTRVLEQLDRDPAEWIDHVADRPNHDRRYLIEPAKIERDLGWRPQVDFKQGLAETVDWYVTSRDWWERVFAAKGELQIDWAAPAPASPAAR